MEVTTTLFGLLGSITASLLFFPQVIASYKSKKVDDIAWSGIGIGMLNGFFWIVYGIMKADPFIYVTNIILFVGAALLMGIKKKYS
jgi:uncharacterized protein with PQ loop repeat